MHVGYPPEIEKYRDEIRALIASWLPPRWLDGVRPQGAAYGEFSATWNDALHARSWAVPTWPARFGGQGIDSLRAAVFAEELARVDAPIQPPAGGELLVGPTILHLGTDAQRDRYLLPIARGRETWCQGFSEPDSGSDLASLRTTATIDGDELVIHGHKIWTSNSQDAQMMFLLARTNAAIGPDQPGAHRGISYLLLDMDQPGVEVRSIAQPDGTAGFAEVFLDGARCPLTNVVGELHGGWRVAMSTLGFERGTSATSSWYRYAADLQDILAVARRRGIERDAVLRQRMARAWSKIQIMRFQGLQVLTAVVHPRTEPAVRGIEAATKMLWTEFQQELTELAIDVLGAEALVLFDDGCPPVGVGLGHRSTMHAYPAGATQSAFLFARSATIFGGTSEVQRNIIGERILGLPR